MDYFSYLVQMKWQELRNWRWDNIFYPLKHENVMTHDNEWWLIAMDKCAEHQQMKTICCAKQKYLKLIQKVAKIRVDLAATSIWQYGIKFICRVDSTFSRYNRAKHSMCSARLLTVDLRMSLQKVTDTFSPSSSLCRASAHNISPSSLVSLCIAW